MTLEPWPMRLHAACATIAWCALLNAYWIIFTLLGGVVLGIGPATVTASILCRRRMRGESVHLRDFASTWRREIIPGTAVVLPVFATVLLLSANYRFFTALGPGAGAARLGTLAALLLAIGVGAYVAPMYAHYELRSRCYLVKSLRFALTRPASTVLLLLVFAAIAFVTAALPVLLVTVSIGLWLQASTWLAGRLFQENEDRLAHPATPGPAQPVRALPTEPLRIR